MEIRFLSIGCGDGIHIRFKGEDDATHHIFIDGGVEAGDIYINVLRKELEQVIDQGEQIDLWIITHIDDDHIGGLLRFIRDTAFRSKFDLSRTEFWFNYSPYDYETGMKTTSKKSVRQGMRLREFLLDGTKLNQAVSIATGTIDLHGCELTILSPDRSQLDQLFARWQKEETIIRSKAQQSKKVTKPNDYNIGLNEFDLSNFEEDQSGFNNSSIAMLLRWGNDHVLLTADSQPSKICSALTALGYSATNKLKLQMMQLAHHGSKFNTSDELLQLIDCEDFLVSADGVNKHNLPNKELLARLKRNFPDKELRVHLTHKNKTIESLLKKDERSAGIKLVFPEPNENYIKLKLH